MKKEVISKLDIYKIKKPEELLKYYQDWTANNKYNKDMVDWNYTAPQETVSVLKKYALNKNSKILDAGCGTGLVGIELKKYVIAKLGVYAVKVYIENKKAFLRGIANLGYRPTFNQKKILLEVNIFNFAGNLYNKNLRVDFVKFIRKEKKFKGIDQLRKQIKLDLKVAKQTY